MGSLRQTHFSSNLNSVTCGSWTDCILTLANGVAHELYLCPRHFHSSLSHACLHCSRSNSSTSSPLRRAPHHLRTHLRRCFFLMFSVSESTMKANRKGLKTDPWWSPTSTAKGFNCSCSTPHYSFALMVHVLHKSDVLLWQLLVSHAPIQFFPLYSVVDFFPDQ